MCALLFRLPLRAVFVGVVLAAAGSVPADPLNEEPVRPLPSVSSLKLDAGKVRLGGRLFVDVRLSGDNSVHCGSCHRMDHGGADRARLSAGAGGQTGRVNAPTVFNSGLNFRQFWDGRAASLEESIDITVQSPREMGSSWPQLLERLRKDHDLVEAFAQAYPGQGMQAASVRDALATYLRSLLTPSPFDRYLAGDMWAIDAEQRLGYRLFKSYGCASCHQGVNLGGNMYQKLGLFRDYYKDHPVQDSADLGRFNVTGRAQDRYVFKVPSLRNVALTAPYFHDGSIPTLESAVAIMLYYQAGGIIDGRDVRYIARFLESLTGTPPAAPRP